MRAVYFGAMIGRSCVVGLTGGIGTGKSRVAELLRELGAAVECADRIVRELQAPGGAGLAAIALEFGAEYLLPSGELDRARLADRVFGDEQARRTLGNLIHPLVQRELARRAAAHAAAGVPVIVLDIPLLLEGRRGRPVAPGGAPYDVIALVYASPASQIERVMARDGLARQDAERRLQAQLPIEEKRALADVVIENDGEWSKTADQVRALYAGWRKRASSQTD
jgi:dephospho-CoA kinase